MKAIVTMALLVAALDTCRPAPFKGTRTYNLETEADRYGRYERVLLGLKTSEGLKLDPAVLEDVRQVLLQEELQESADQRRAPQRYRTVGVRLGRPLQSRHIAQLLYRERLQAGSSHKRNK